MSYSWLDMVLYLVIYAFLGWLAEAVCYAVAKRRFYNRGLLSMPLILTYGVTFDVLLILLPTLESWILRFLTVLVIAAVVESLATFFTSRVTPRVE